MKRIIIPIMIAFLIVPTVAGLQIEDNLFFTIPEGEEIPANLRCVDVVFPDDSGDFPTGLETYTLTTNSEWASLSYRIITTDVNNTVIIPICYTKRGENLCSDPYVVSILSHTYNLSREFIGGVCVSGYADVDVISDALAQGILDTNTSPLDVLNNNVDLFDIGFETEKIHARPGEPVIFNLFLESQALLNIDLDVVDSDIQVSPQAQFTTTSSVNSFREFPYSLTSPLSVGEYYFEVEASVRDCDQAFCSKRARAELVVTQSPPDEGFSVKLFPLSLNIRELRPVLYRFTVDNLGPARSFDIDIELSEGLTSTFRPETLDLAENEKETISFTVVPSQGSSQYQITVTASSNGDSKPVTAYLSTNEMLTDIQRYADQASNANPDAAQVIENMVQDYAQDYNDSVYGEDLEQYEDVRQDIDQVPDNGGSSPPPVTTGTGIDLTLIIFVVIIIVVIGAVGFLFLKKKKQSYVPKDTAEIE